MNIKNMLISVAIVGVLSLCAFNSVTAAPVSKFTPDNQGNCAANVNGRQQTYITAAASLIDPFCPGTKLTLQVGSPVELFGVLSASDKPTSYLQPLQPLVTCDIHNPKLILQRLNAGNGTWSTVATDRTQFFSTGEYVMNLTPKVAGASMYRVLYYGDSNYAPAVSNEIMLIVTNTPPTMWS